MPVPLSWIVGLGLEFGVVIATVEARISGGIDNSIPKSGNCPYEMSVRSFGVDYTRRNVGICGRSPFYFYSLIGLLSSVSVCLDAMCLRFPFPLFGIIFPI
jgi:hypothetical protein